MARRQKRRMLSLKKHAQFSSSFGIAFKKGKFLLLSIHKHIKRVLSSVLSRIDKKPVTSFLTTLTILLLLIILGSFLRKPKPETSITHAPKEVTTYSIGKAPKISLQGKIEKSGIVKVVALAPGVVNTINVTEGQEVQKGTILVSLASNYSGGNAPGIQRQIAEAALTSVNDTYNIQTELIQKQRELSDKSRGNTEELRKISSDSLDQTRSLLSLNQEIVDSLKSSLANLESTNSGGVNDTTILQTKQLISQFQSGVNQLQSQIKNTEYATDTNNNPTKLASISQEVTKKQLDIQERALKLSQETSQLQLQLAQVAEATMYPSAPFSGVIERVYVNPGENVNPGTPLVVIHGAQTLKFVLKVPKSIAKKVSLLEEATIHIRDTSIKLQPSYISTDATDGDLYSIIFQIPDEYQNDISNNEFLTVDMPVGHAQTSAAIPFVPIDAVYQTENDAYIFINKHSKAVSKKIQLGNVTGSFVEVENGLSSGDQVIVSRNVVAGDNVKSTN